MYTIPRRLAAAQKNPLLVFYCYKMRSKTYKLKNVSLTDYCSFVDNWVVRDVNPDFQVPSDGGSDSQVCSALIFKFLTETY